MDERQDSKSRALREHGALHPRPNQVHDPLFQHSEFFDPRDLVLVKYEMLRRVRVEAPAGQRSGQGLRLLAGGVLPGDGRLPEGGLAGPAAPPAWSQAGQQAHRGGAGVHRPATGRRRQPAGARTGGDGPGAPGPIGASPQHRAGLGTEGKKGATRRAVVAADDRTIVGRLDTRTSAARP